MKAIMITYDSLNRRFLSPYGCDWVQTPNFDRLAEKAVVFDNSYVGSLPCIPARRELHTGRLNFLHRSWGPVEPFDDSMPEILKNNGIHSHLTSDHGHYWEDGGCTFHTRYQTWDFHRVQEGDPWKPVVGEVSMPDHLGQLWRQDAANRQFMQTEEQLPQSKTFGAGVEFLDINHAADNWFLHVETFDPHEPFFTTPEYQELYEKDYEGPLFDWPSYAKVSKEEEPYVEHVRNLYAGLVTMCDKNLGKILDKMDEHGLWEDTMLIVNTDHGFFLGERGWWAKTNDVNLFDEVSHTPLFIYDPRSRATGHNKNLVQTIDLAPTVLEYFQLPIPKDMMGISLSGTIADNKPIRETCIFGVHSVRIACTNGRQVYMHAPENYEIPHYEYTLMPTHMRRMYSVDELQDWTQAEPFSFTKGCRLIRTSGFNLMGMRDAPQQYETLLFDLEKDPGEEHPIQDTQMQQYFKDEIARHMLENDAPAELYQRMGLHKPS